MIKKYKKGSVSKPTNRILVAGEILVDNLPSGPRPGGAPFNFALHLHRMGFDVHLVSAVGDDENGRMLLDLAQSFGLNTDWIQRCKDRPTGVVNVSLDEHGVPDYEIVENVAYDFIDFNQYPLRDENQPDYFYFGSLAQRTELARQGLHHFIDHLSPSVRRVYDMNIRSSCESSLIILPSLKKTDVLKLNEAELLATANMIEWKNKVSSLDLSAKIVAEKYNIDEVIVTRGPEGSELYKNGARFIVPAGVLSADDVVDTVGAGDSFAAAYVGSCIQGFSSIDALRNASSFADKICSTVGAIPLDESFYADLKFMKRD